VTEERRLVAEEGSYPKKTWLSNTAEAWWAPVQGPSLVLLHSLYILI